MSRLLKCYGTCEGKYPKEELIKYKGKNYCSECLKQIQARDRDYDALCEYICKIFKCDFVNPYIKKQIKDYEAGGFSLKGMRSTLWYVVNILKMRLDERYGIAIVKSNYYSAKKYAEERYKQKKQAKSREEIKPEIKYVNVNRYRENKPKKKFSLEDLNIDE